jgi:hypothetical protein
MILQTRNLGHPAARAQQMSYLWLHNQPHAAVGAWWRGELLLAMSVEVKGAPLAVGCGLWLLNRKLVSVATGIGLTEGRTKQRGGGCECVAATWFDVCCLSSPGAPWCMGPHGAALGRMPHEAACRMGLGTWHGSRPKKNPGAGGGGGRREAGGARHRHRHRHSCYLLFGALALLGPATHWAWHCHQSTPSLLINLLSNTGPTCFVAGRDGAPLEEKHEAPARR